MKELIKLKLKRIYLLATGKVSHFKKKVDQNHVWYGGKHAGFFVCPDVLNEHSIVYSFGIGENISFDKTLIENHQCSVFAFDPTPKSINWLKNQELPSNFKYFDYGIANKSGLVDFYLPKNPDFVSGSLVAQDNVDSSDKVSVKMKSIQDIITELGHSHIDVLKMDIEGSEYDVIDTILETDVAIDQILIEFHDRFFEDGVKKSKDAVQKLNAHGFEVFAVSDNFEEVSFINTRLAKVK